MYEKIHHIEKALWGILRRFKLSKGRKKIERSFSINLKLDIYIKIHDDQEVPEGRRRIKRVLDSSDEDSGNVETPAKERKKKLENLVNRINKVYEQFLITFEK